MSHYTKDPTRDFETLVEVAALSAGAFVLDGPLSLTCIFYFEWPKSDHRKREPKGLGWMFAKPDFDNLSKGIADGLNGVAYKDDGQVAAGHIFKLRIPQGESSRTVIILNELALPPNPSLYFPES